MSMHLNYQQCQLYRWLNHTSVNYSNTTVISVIKINKSFHKLLYYLFVCKHCYVSTSTVLKIGNDQTDTVRVNDSDLPFQGTGSKVPEPVPKPGTRNRFLNIVSLMHLMTFFKPSAIFFTEIGLLAFFRPPLGDLRATYDDLLRLLGKRVVDFLLALIELFSLGVKAGALRAIIGSKSAILRPPLGDLRATYNDHLRLLEKRVVDFLLALIELFSLGVTAEALRAIIGSKSAILLQRGPVDPKF